MKEVKILKMLQKQLNQEVIAKSITMDEYNIRFQTELSRAIEASGLTRSKFLGIFLKYSA
jgi:hypothetical protein